jgi:hypothetical protein
VRRGPNYVLRAIDDNDREVNLVINARSGDIVSVTPIQTASRMPPASGVAWAPMSGCCRAIFRPADGQLQPAGTLMMTTTRRREATVTVAPRPPSAMPETAAAFRAMPRRLRVADQYSRMMMRPSLPSRSARPERDHGRSDRSGFLPPPPERFPQRVAPAAPPKPKPVTRAAAAPPKPAPLPKPKPGRHRSTRRPLRRTGLAVHARAGAGRPRNPRPRRDAALIKAGVTK